MVTMTNILARRDDILRICRRHGGYNVRVFGSVVRGEASQASDLDLLVELDENHSLLDRIAIWNELQDYLGMRVDVVSPRGLHEAIKDQVLAEAVSL